MRTLICLLALSSLLWAGSADARASTKGNAAVLAKLEKQVSFDFVRTPLKDVAAFFSHLAGVAVVVDPAATGKSVSMKVTNLKLRDAIDVMAKKAGISFHVAAEAAYLGTKTEASIAAAGVSLSSARDPKLRAALDRTISFDFANTPFQDVLAFLSQIASINVVTTVDDDSLAKLKTTLRVKDMKMSNAFQWLAVLTNTRIQVRGAVVMFVPGTAR